LTKIIITFNLSVFLDYLKST